MNHGREPASSRPTTLVAVEADHSLDDRPGTTVVVGAARGIEASVGEHLSATDWNKRILLADVDGPGVEVVAENIRTPGVAVESRAVDITDAEQRPGCCGWKSQLNVRVNTASPGATDTPMMRSLAGDHLEPQRASPRQAPPPRGLESPTGAWRLRTMSPAVWPTCSPQPQPT